MDATPVKTTDLKPGDNVGMGVVVSTKVSPSGKTIVISAKRPDGTVFTDRVSTRQNMYVFTGA
jgi:hypothetical protein